MSDNPGSSDSKRAADVHPKSIDAKESDLSQRYKHMLPVPARATSYHPVTVEHIPFRASQALSDSSGRSQATTSRETAENVEDGDGRGVEEVAKNSSKEDDEIFKAPGPHGRDWVDEHFERYHEAKRFEFLDLTDDAQERWDQLESMRRSRNLVFRSMQGLVGRFPSSGGQTDVRIVERGTNVDSKDKMVRKAS